VTRMAPDERRLLIGFVIPPLPRAKPRPATDGAWQSLATWSTLFVLRAALASFARR